MRALVWLIAVVALGAVAFFTIQRYPVLIETDLKQRASQALESAKLSFAKVTVAGRVVTLSGEAPGATAKEDAVKVAGDVWGVQQVNDALVIPAAATLPVAPQAVIGSAAQAPNREVPAPPSPQPLEVPPPAGEPATALPTVEALVDPSLAPPIDADSSEPASPSPPTETAIPPAQTAPAAPAPAAPAAAPVTSPAVPAQPHLRYQLTGFSCMP